jgi:hypothetical protein
MNSMRARDFAKLLLLTPLLASSWGQQPQPTPIPRTSAVKLQSGPITVAELLSNKKESYIGSPITLRDVQITGKASKQAVWVGTVGQEILVTIPATVHAIDPAGNRVELARGDTIRLSGVVQRAPLAHLLQLGWGLGRDQAASAEAAGIIINALKIEVSPAPTR